MSNFITEIKIKKVRHLENIDIKLGDEKKHLILTGKNGCGKTSVLEALDGFFIETFKKHGQIGTFYDYKDKLNSLDKISHKPLINLVKKFSFCYPIFNQNTFHLKIKDENLDFVYAFFSAKRSNQTDKPQGINKINFPKGRDAKLNKNFLQYIVNLKAEKSFARDDNELEIVKKIDEWFEKFETMLKQIFSDNSLKLIFDRKDYNFMIHRANREPFDFNGLSAGYSAIIDIVTELILKIENTEFKSFECEGIVLIDEVENHLHVELQKNILPLLTTFFPNIQFIVTTHSPFVLQSIENSVVYDLEKNMRVEDLSDYSYDALIESYFDSDKYSQAVKNKIEKFEELTNKSHLTDDEKDEYYQLKKHFDSLPTFMSDELGVKLNEIKLKNLFKVD